MAVPKVLLVDDDPSVRAFIQAMLEREGFQVETFASAEALTAFAGPDEPSCFVLDYHLPGVDGLTLVRTLRSLGARAPALITCSCPSREMRAQAAALGTTVIEKPLLADKLMAVVREPGACHRA